MEGAGLGDALLASWVCSGCVCPRAGVTGAEQKVAGVGMEMETGHPLEEATCQLRGRVSSGSEAAWTPVRLALWLGLRCFALGWAGTCFREWEPPSLAGEA